MVQREGTSRHICSVTANGHFKVLLCKVASSEKAIDISARNNNLLQNPPKRLLTSPAPYSSVKKPIPFRYVGGGYQLLPANSHCENKGIRNKVSGRAGSEHSDIPA